jgi:glycosyltransferase involved in cell wall biosynthesis
MKILQIIPSVSLVYGGPSQMILGLSKALATEGVEVTLITTDSNGDTGQLPLNIPLETPLKQDGYTIIYFRCFPFRRYKFSWDLLQWLNLHITEYDLVHIHALFSPVSTVSATIARYKKVPYILRPLGTLDPADLKKKQLFKQIYGRLLEKPNLRKAAAIHFTSEQECKISERFGIKTNDLVLPLGVDLIDNLPERGQFREKLGISTDIPLLLYMSRIDPKKGLDLLIPALEILLEEGKIFHFILAGANPQDLSYENKIQQQIQQSKLGEYTTMTGFVSGDQKLGLLIDADLFILPSYYENFGIAVVEAMGVGTPVVISDQVHIWEEIEAAKAGWITPCQTESLSNTIRLALQDTNQLKRRGIYARQLTLQHYSWQAISRQMKQAYQKLIGN